MPMPLSDQAMLQFCRDLLSDMDKNERPSVPELRGALGFSVRRIEELEQAIREVTYSPVLEGSQFARLRELVPADSTTESTE